MERGDGKRQREDSAEEALSAKKLREADLKFLDMLEDADAVDRSATAPPDSDLEDVMRSFEEEIAASSPSASERLQNLDSASATERVSFESTSDGDDSRQSDLGYLLEASDDELGLPPAGICLSDDGDRREENTAEDDDQIWSLNEEIQKSYDVLEFEAFENDFWPAENNEEVIFDGGLFDSPNLGAAYMPSDRSEFFWQAETTSAV